MDVLSGGEKQRMAVSIIQDYKLVFNYHNFRW
jgi:hypothetical protein